MIEFGVQKCVGVGVGAVGILDDFLMIFEGLIGRPSHDTVNSKLGQPGLTYEREARWMMSIMIDVAR